MLGEDDQSIEECLHRHVATSTPPLPQGPPQSLERNQRGQVEQVQTKAKPDTEPESEKTIMQLRLNAAVGPVPPTVISAFAKKLEAPSLLGKASLIFVVVWMGWKWGTSGT